MTKQNRYNSGTNYVPPTVEGEVVGGQLRPQAQITYEPMPGTITAQPAQRAQLRQVETVKSTSVDRAHAFAIRTRSISMMTGGAGALAWFMLRWALPLTTGATTAGVLVVGAASVVFGLFAFFTVWTGAYLVDMATSPGGISLFEAWRTQRRIDSQSDAMVDAYRKSNGVNK